jgi:zinc protease
MIDFEKHVLTNGLTVLAHYDATTPMVTTNILYKTGARDEDPEATGFAHLFEHLMFEGSVNIPVFDTPVILAGGENNAFTTNDITNYYITLPANNVETAFWLESDRMLGLDLAHGKLETQKRVVIEEYRQRYLNQPYGDLFLLLRPLAYKVHPYMWPTIGKDISHIEKADDVTVARFFKEHYVPGNAILSVGGNIKPDEVFRLAEKWFMPIPCGEKKQKPIPAEPKQQERREMTVYRDVPANELLMAFHTSGRKDHDFYVLDLLTDILAGCESGRFPNVLVREKELFNEIDTYLTGDTDPGLVIISGRLKDGVEIAKAEAAVKEQLNIICSVPANEYELEKARNRYESHHLMAMTSASNKAFNLAFFEMLGDASGINTESEKYMDVSVEDIMDTAQRTFTQDNLSVINYLAERK